MQPSPIGPGVGTNAAKPHIGSLDTLRTVAALAVVLGHLQPLFITSLAAVPALNHTALAVDFFFVLSGFVIAINYWEISGPQAVWHYLRLRFARIYPLHLLTLLLFLGLECAKYVAQSRLALSSSSAAFSDNNWSAFLLNLVLLNAHGMIPSATFNGPSWSIGAEASCYVLFGAIALLTRSPRLRLGVLLACVAISAATFQQFDLSLFGALRGVAGFGLGCAWWVWLRNVSPGRDGDRPRRRWFDAGTASTFCVGLIILGVACLIGQVFYPGIHILSLGVIGWSLLNPTHALSRIAGRLGQGWFGQVSYGVYLWHPLAILLASKVLKLLLHYPMVEADGRLMLACPRWVGDLTVLAVMAATLGVGHLSFKYFESPWRRRLRPAVPARVSRRPELARVAL